MKLLKMSYCFKHLVFLVLFGMYSIVLHAQIGGEKKVTVGEKMTYTVDIKSKCSRYEWKLPRGFDVVGDKNSSEINVVVSYLAQSGKLKVNCIQKNGSIHSEEIPITVEHPINKSIHHSIKKGEELHIGDNIYTERGIYFENKEDGSITAHSLSVLPEFERISKSYIQCLTSSSVWISWKTDFKNAPSVEYIQDGKTKKAKGDCIELSDKYYWNAVQLTELTPHTEYTYTVSNDREKSNSYTFKTSPNLGDNTKVRVLVLGDHQMPNRSGYEWLIQAAEKTSQAKYGQSLSQSMSFVINTGDQVDVSTLEQYEKLHLYKNNSLSPNIPILTVVGNHDTYYDPKMERYGAHYYYSELDYKGIKSGTDNYYAYQYGRVLFVSIDAEHEGAEQEAWLKQVANEAKHDKSVDFLVSAEHRPLFCEQYVGDYSSWARNIVMPILNISGKHVLNLAGHHHLYHRGQFTNDPLYHVISGGTVGAPSWGTSTEKDFLEVQMTIDLWAYQIIEFDMETKKMEVSCYSIGNQEIVLDNQFIDQFSRQFGKEPPKKPKVDITSSIRLPYTVSVSAYKTNTESKLNTSQFQVSSDPTFSRVSVNSIRDVENIYGSTNKPLYIPIDINENIDITNLLITEKSLKEGTNYIRVRYRDDNLEWSPWSKIKSFEVENGAKEETYVNLEVDKKSVPIGEKFNIKFSNAPVDSKAWIGIYENIEGGYRNKSYIKFEYTDKLQNQIWTTAIDKKGEYLIVLFGDNGYDEIFEPVELTITE